MQGFCVRWASESACHVTLNVLAHFTIVYSVLVGTLVSIGLHQFTLSDAQFAITVTHSPLSFYLIYVSIRSLLNKPTLVMDRLEGLKRPTQALAVGLLFFWIALDTIVMFGRHAFTDGRCQDTTWRDWATVLIDSWFVSPLYTFATAEALGIPVYVFLLIGGLVYYVRTTPDSRRATVQEPLAVFWRVVSFLPSLVVSTR